MNNRTTLMFVYNDLNNDARVQRSLRALEKISNVEIVSIDNKFENCNNKIFNSNSKSSLLRYFHIIRQVVEEYKNKKYNLYYAHDFHSSIPMLILSRLKGDSILIYDAHELFIPIKGEPWSLYLSFFHFFEKKIIKRADIIICAQENRAQIMKKYYNLSNTPIVISNISKLSVTQSYISRELEAFMNNNGKIVIYAGVLVKDRKLEKLIESISEFSNEYKLLIVGDGPGTAYLKNVASKFKGLEYLFTGKIPYSMLGNILNRCQVGYIFYPIDSLNNKYCASNKVFEYSSVNLPILANNNPSLKLLIENEDMPIGVCTDDFASGLKQLNLYSAKYINNTIKFNKTYTWDEMERKLINNIEKLLLDRKI